MDLLFDLPRMVARYFRMYRDHTGRGIYLLLVLNIIGSYAEGLGIALFFPLLMSGQGDHDPLSSTLVGVFRFLHIAPTPLGALPFIVVLFVLKGTLLFASSSYQYYLFSQIPLRVRRKLISGMGRVDYRAILGTNTGYQSNLLVNEASRFASGFIHFVRTLPPALNVVVFFAIVVVLDWRVTLVCALMGGVVLALVRVSGRIAQRYSFVTSRENASLSSLLIQMLHAFKYLRATGVFAAFQKHTDEAAERLAKADYHSGVATSFSIAISQPLMVIALASLLYYRIGIRGEQIGAFFVMLMYFFRIMTELWGVQLSWQNFCGYVGVIDMVQGALANVAENVEANGDVPFDGLRDAISLRRVSYSYVPERAVLRDIELTIPKNAMVAFVGESGSGKSTLVDLITGTLKPDAGTITIDGRSLAEIELVSFRRRIGYVPQDATLFDDTVSNNICLWTEAGGEQIREAARGAKCLEFIEAMPDGFASQIGDRGIKLSGGQRQRLAIARELLKRPDILVLDEATSALDTQSERAIQQTIDGLKGAMTILIIAHRLSTIRNCDLVVVLHEGCVVEAGSYNELISRPGSRFSRMCELQQLTQPHA